jgi:hypothetical protein
VFTIHSCSKTPETHEEIKDYLVNYTWEKDYGRWLQVNYFQSVGREFALVRIDFFNDNVFRANYPNEPERNVEGIYRIACDESGITVIQFRPSISPYGLLFYDPGENVLSDGYYISEETGGQIYDKSGIERRHTKKASKTGNYYRRIDKETEYISLKEEINEKFEEPVVERNDGYIYYESGLDSFMTESIPTFTNCPWKAKVNFTTTVFSENFKIGKNKQSERNDFFGNPFESKSNSEEYNVGISPAFIIKYFGLIITDTLYLNYKKVGGQNIEFAFQGKKINTKYGPSVFLTDEDILLIPNYKDIDGELKLTIKGQWYLKEQMRVTAFIDRDYVKKINNTIEFVKQQHGIDIYEALDPFSE